MKTIILMALFGVGRLADAQQQDKGISGDYDGNGTKEYAYIKVKDCSDECDGSCETTIYFSDKKIQPLTISPAKGVTLYNLSDLNGDGRDELGAYPGWCTSCWHPFYVYTYARDTWKPLVKPISTHCSQWEEDKFPIKKDPEKKGYVIVTSSQWKDDDIKISSESVKLN